MRVIRLLFFFLCCSVSGLASVHYLDPVNGSLDNSGSMDSPWSSLESVIDAGYISSQAYFPLPYDPYTSSLVAKNENGPIQAGDTLMLLDGLHGRIYLESYINAAPITIIGADGHNAQLHSVHLLSCKNWRFEHVNISNEPYGEYTGENLFTIESHSWQGPASHIFINDCDIYSTDAPWTTADEWNAKMSNGIYIAADSVNVINSSIRNSNFGLQAAGNYILAESNEIINFAGDGMRVIGSNIIFKYNLIKNCYVVNDNHDDGIQSWAEINGVVSDDNQLIGNVIINTDDENRPLNGPLQGIGCFDGFFNRWKVINNVVIVDHWHGITFLGARDCDIINNTVIDLTPDVTPGESWILIDDHKNGTPSSGCVIANNVANDFIVDGIESNNQTLNTYQAYADNFVDYINLDFHPKPNSVLIDAGDVAYAPSHDIELRSRDNGAGPDVGAYEFVDSISNIIDHDINRISIYPNPTSNNITIAGVSQFSTVQLFNQLGKVILQSEINDDSDTQELQLGQLTSGLYVLRIIDNNSSNQYSENILIQR